MLSITINGATIDKYLSKYDVTISKQYSDKSFVAIDGTDNSVFLGYRRELSVDFEPMSTKQINELFTAITKNEQAADITYIDPLDGEKTRKFKTESLPAATFFESDYTYNSESGQGNTQFWTIPTITFVEDVSSWDSG